jgi:hypothetical protein
MYFTLLYVFVYILSPKITLDTLNSECYRHKLLSSLLYRTRDVDMRIRGDSCSDNGRNDHTNLLHYGCQSYLLLPYGGTM